MRVRANFFEGTLSSQLLSGATTVMSSALSGFPEVAYPDTASLVIGDSRSSREVVKVTAHTVGSTSATVVRGQDDTTDRTWPAGTPVLQGPVASDYPTAPPVRQDFLPANWRGAVVWTFDDIHTDQIPLIEFHASLDQRVALGVVSDWVDDGNRMTSAQLYGYHRAGHELMNHSDTHANYTSATASDRATESDTCSDFIETLTGVRPVSFVYPQGAWSATTDRELHCRFKSWAVTLSDAQRTLPDKYPLGDTFPRWYRVDLDSTDNLDRAAALIRQAATAPIVVSFYLHRPDQPGGTTTSQYEALAQLAYDLGVPSLLPREVFGSVGMLSDGSFEEPDMPTWGLNGVVGAATATQVTATPDSGLSGTQVLEFENAGSGEVAIMSQPIIVEPAVVYTVSGRVKVASGNLTTNDIGIRVRWRDAVEAAVSQSVNYPTISGSWARFTYDYTAPATARAALIDLYFAPGSTRVGAIHVDHVDVRPANLLGLG